MRDKRIAGVQTRTSATGLGVCDAWRLELTAEQVPWLIEGLDASRASVEEAVRLARSHHAVGDSDEVAEREYELRLVRLMRRLHAAGADDKHLVFVGPAELVRELVPAVVMQVSDAFASHVRDLQPTNAESRARLGGDRDRRKRVGADPRRLLRARSVPLRSGR